MNRRAILLAAVLALLPSAALAADGDPMLVHGYVDSGTTADGTPTAPGVAACPLRMALGTVLLIEGIGTVVCHDRTPGNPELVDVWVGSVAEAFALTGYRRVWTVGP